MTWDNRQDAPAGAQVQPGLMAMDPSVVSLFQQLQQGFTGPMGAIGGDDANVMAMIHGVFGNERIPAI